MPYTCNLDADGWQLYSYEEDPQKQRKVEKAARFISRTLTEKVAEGKALLASQSLISELKLAGAIRDQMYDILAGKAGFGGTDTEPSCVLVSELESAFGLDPYSLDR